MRFFTIIAIAVLAFMPLPAQAAVSPEKVAAIQEMITLMRVDDVVKGLGDQLVKGIMEDMKRKRPPVEPKMRAAIEDEARLFVKEEMTKESFAKYLYPIYDKLFTAQELKDIVTFYKTPSGRKSLQVMPVLMQESMAVGQQWSAAQMTSWQRRLGNRIKKEMGTRQ